MKKWWLEVKFKVAWELSVCAWELCELSAWEWWQWWE